MAAKSNLPEETLSDLESAREYTEGKSIRLDIATADDVAVVKKLIDIKMSI